MHRWGGDHGSSFLIFGEKTPRQFSPGVDLVARDLWKLTGVAIVFNVVVAVCAYWIFSFIRIRPLQLLFIWFPLYLCAALPHLIEQSVRPFWSSRPHYEDGSTVIWGNHQSIALITTGLLLYAFAGGTMAAEVGAPAWFPTNVARNSPPHYSNFEMRPLQFQRFRGTSKTDQGKLRATFRGGPVAPGRRGRGWPGGYAHSRGPGTPGHNPFTRELPVRAPSVGGLRTPQPIHTGAPGSRSQRRRVAASTTHSHGGSPTGNPHPSTAAPHYANPFGCSARTALAGLTASRLVSGSPTPALSVLNQAKSRASPRQP